MFLLAALLAPAVGAQDTADDDNPLGLSLIRSVEEAGDPRVPLPVASSEGIRYYRSGMIQWGLATALGFAIPLLILASGLSGRMWRWCTGKVRWFGAAVLFTVLYFTLVWLLELPLDFYRGFVRQHAYGLSNQSFGQWMSDSVKNLLFLSNRERLTHLLLELAEQYGAPAADGIRLRIQLSHQDLANVIGSTRETVTVVLGELQQEGLITIGRRRIVITAIQKLADSVQRAAPQLPAIAQVGG